ncbi:MAG: 30S ribosomal protein S21 [bacterium]
MAEIKINGNENIEKALKRFRLQCKKEGIIKMFKERQYYKKPSQKRREKIKNEKRAISKNTNI